MLWIPTPLKVSDVAALGIAHTTHWHAPVFTVEEGRDLKASMPGGHTKNLFLTDKDGAIILIAIWLNTRIFTANFSFRRKS